MSALSIAIYTYAQERLVGETLDSVLSALSPANAKGTEIVVSDTPLPTGRRMSWPRGSRGMETGSLRAGS